MFLVHLDSNNAVESVTPITDSPMHTPMSNRYLLAVVAPQVGFTFDEASQSFVPPPRKRWITRLAFDNRFTMPEATRLKLAQVYPTRNPEETDAEYSARCTVPATLQVMQGRINLASYIDLDRADTRTGVQQLEALGLIAAGRALEILDGEIEDSEYHPSA